MKQRLLLALLVLFASVGSTWGQSLRADESEEGAVTVATPLKNGSVTLTIPKGKTVTITVSENVDNTNTAIKDMILSTSGNEATFSSGETAGGAVTSTSFTLKAGSSVLETATSYTAKFEGGYYKSLTIGAGPTKIIFDESTAFNTTALNVQAGSVEELKLNKLYGTLTSLTVGANKLSTFAKKTAKMTTYSIGAQSGTFPGIPSTDNRNVKPANGPIDFSLSVLLNGLDNMNAETSFTLKNWRYKSATATSYLGTSYPHTDASKPNRYYFYNNSSNTYQDGYEWMDGEYMCDIYYGDDSNFPGAILKDVKIYVAPASYQLDKPDIMIGSNKAGTPSNVGTVTVLKGGVQQTFSSSINLVKGDKLTLKPTAKDGYKFSKFTSENFVIKEIAGSNGLYEAEVLGKTMTKTSIAAVFEAVGQTLTIQTPSNGSITVYDGTTEIKDGGSVAYGKTIKIYATPNDGYEVDKLFVNAGEPTFVETKGTTKIYSYTIQTTDAIVITASFKQSTSSTLTLKWVKEKIASIQLDGVDTDGNGPSTEETVGGVTYKTKTYTVNFNTKPSIKITTAVGVYLSSIVTTDGEQIKTTIVSKETASVGTTYLISDFVMPNQALTFVLNTSEKSDAKILVDAVLGTGSTHNYNGKIVYDGTVKAIPYVTDPNGLDNVVVEYNTEDGDDVYYSKTAFDKAGKYKVRFSRASDDIYKAAVVYASDGTTPITNGEILYTIDPATPIVTTEPTIEIGTDGKYVVKSLGTVQYLRGTSKQTIDSKKYVWEVLKDDGTTPKENTELSAVSAGKYSSEVVTVRLHLKDNVNKDWSEASGSENYDTNFAKEIKINVKAKGQVDNVKTVKLEIYSKLPTGTSLKMFNGTKEITSGSSVPEGTTISFEVGATGYTTSSVIQVDVNGANLNSTFSSSNTISATGEKMIFSVSVTGTLGEMKELVLVSAEDTKEYTGKVQGFVFSSTSIEVKVKGASSSLTYSDAMWKDATVTYKDPNGVATTSPINAGVYTVTITRPADVASTSVGYKAFTATGKLIITPAKPTIINWPNTNSNNAAKIGKGQPLSSAVLTGGIANVEGTFEWVTPTTVVNTDGQYPIKFVSKDSNYKDVVSTTDAWVKISNESILSISSDDTYTITVKGSDGKEYKSGQTVPVGITLTFTVNPAATYKLKALYVNGVAISGNTYKTTAGPIAVKAEMEQEFTVSVSTSVKGIQLVLPSSSVVKKGESYSFSVKGLAADLANLVVSDGTTTYAGTNGAYTISNITANKTITVTMRAGTAPTQVEAVIEANLSTQGKSMGTVTVTKISSLRADAVDSSIQKFYYGDKIRITATPAAGCRFVGWEGRTETSSVIDVTITETSYKFKAVFAGSPTGAEVIEGVDIYGSNGEIVVKCDGAARITIVSMNGQSKQQEISGDTRIPAGAGIYGIVFEQGNNVMRTKVAVK